MYHDKHILDSDSLFLIDPLTREISNATLDAKSVIQFDHNSERFTFEIPRYIEGHDMSTCNSVQVHYLNISSDKKDQNTGVYDIDDLHVSDDEKSVICTWLISRNATKYVGSLVFLLRFACVVEEDVQYLWHTTLYKDISVLSGLCCSEPIPEKYPDILDQFSANINDLRREIENINIKTDPTLSIPGAAADSKIVGERFTEMIRQIEDMDLPDITSEDDGKILGVVGGKWVVTNPTKELPEATSANNGKILKVVNGKWAIVEQDKDVPIVSGVDNGKIMQVVDGAWNAVSLANSTVKTYIDEYIAAALGGDY